MASPLKQPPPRRVGIRKLSASASVAQTTPRLEAILTSKKSSAAQVTKWPSRTASRRQPRRQRIPASVRSFSLRRLVPGWLVRAVVMLAAISASWLALIWVMVTQDPAQSSSRVVFVVSVFAMIFVTSLPIMHRIFSWFAPSRLQQGNPVLVAGPRLSACQRHCGKLEFAPGGQLERDDVHSHRRHYCRGGIPLPGAEVSAREQPGNEHYARVR